MPALLGQPWPAAGHPPPPPSSSLQEPIAHAGASLSLDSSGVEHHPFFSSLGTQRLPLHPLAGCSHPGETCPGAVWKLRPLSPWPGPKFHPFSAALTPTGGLYIGQSRSPVTFTIAINSRPLPPLLRARTPGRLCNQFGSCSYPNLGHLRYCNNLPLQVKETYSDRIRRFRSCDFGNRSAGKPEKGKRELLRRGLNPPARRCAAALYAGYEDDSALRYFLSFALNRWFCGRTQRRLKLQSAARAHPCAMA